MTKKKTSQDRKARLEEIQRQQKAGERRTVMMIAAGCVALLVVLGGVVLYAVNDAKAKQLPNLGVEVAAAKCDPITTDTSEGSGEHVGPGTNKPDQTTVDYKTLPPSAGPHFVQPDVSGREFYTAADRPPLETLVHNLEHGYTILWYDGGKVKDTALLKDIAAKANNEPESMGKFKAVEWDGSRGALPAGKSYVLAHWSKDAGHRQMCGDLSGQVVVDFVKKYPANDTQEPGAA